MTSSDRGEELAAAGGSENESTRVRVIERSLDILESMSDGPRTLSEICRDTELSKGTAFRLLAGLSHRGVVVKDPVSSRYMLGPGLLRLVSGAVSGLASIATLGRHALSELALTTGETIAIHVQIGLERVCIQEVPSPQAIRYTSLVGSSAPLTVGSAGKVLLAFMDAKERDRLLPLLTEGDDFDGLGSLLNEIHDHGYALSVAERVEGASAISIPVGSEHLLMSLSVLGPTSRLTDETLIGFLDPMRAAAKEIAAVVNETG